MAQLTDDCFAFGGSLLPVDDALARIQAAVKQPMPAEMIPLERASGRVLAEPVAAIRHVPPHPNAAVDGYAVAFEDLNSDGPTSFALSDVRLVAGHPHGSLEKADIVGKATRIFTGALLPDGLDTIFMQEDVELEGQNVVVPSGLKKGSNARKAGEDIRGGAQLLSQGQSLRPQDIGLLAAQGITDVMVHQRPRVALFSTGDELVNLGEQPGVGQVYDSNRWMLRALIESLGAVVTDLGILPDDKALIERAFRDAGGNADVIVTSGGVSSGEEDHVRLVLEELGQLHFWRMALKPGRPLALGQIGDSAFVGLPGNPVAAMVCALVCLRPLLRTLQGDRTSAAHAYGIAAFDAKKKTGRREYLRVRQIGEHASGLPQLEAFPNSGAGILSGLHFANGLAEIGEDIETVQPGDRVKYHRFDALLSTINPMGVPT